MCTRGRATGLGSHKTKYEMNIYQVIFTRSENEVKTEIEAESEQDAERLVRGTHGVGHNTEVVVTRLRKYQITTDKGSRFEYYEDVQAVINSIRANPETKEHTFLTIREIR